MITDPCWLGPTKSIMCTFRWLVSRKPLKNCVFLLIALTHAQFKSCPKFKKVISWDGHWRPTYDMSQFNAFEVFLRKGGGEGKDNPTDSSGPSLLGQDLENYEPKCHLLPVKIRAPKQHCFNIRSVYFEVPDWGPSQINQWITNHKTDQSPVETMIIV